MNKQEKKGFTMGVVYAIAQCCRLGTDAEMLWKESGLDEADLSVCDDYDADAVREMLVELEAEGE